MILSPLIDPHRYVVPSAGSKTETLWDEDASIHRLRAGKKWENTSNPKPCHDAGFMKKVKRVRKEKFVYETDYEVFAAVDC